MDYSMSEDHAKMREHEQKISALMLNTQMGDSPD